MSDQQARERAEAVVVREALKELTAARLRAGESPQTAMPKARAEEAAFTALLAENERLEEARDALTKIKNYRGAPYIKHSPDSAMRKIAKDALARDAADTEETT